VRVLEFLEKHDLAVSSLGICGILEGIKIFFQSVKPVIFAILHFPDDAVSSTPDFLQDFETLADVRLNFLVLAHDNYQ